MAQVVESFPMQIDGVFCAVKNPTRTIKPANLLTIISPSPTYSRLCS
ncbi:hypothetical protein SPLC1_S032590 [Arthrospira platensis C1]|nr:hypothetical protein SPLC1_S032590 [Arthrospira platensis C1]